MFSNIHTLIRKLEEDDNVDDNEVDDDDDVDDTDVDDDDDVE